MRLDLLWWLLSIHSPSLFQFLVAHYFPSLVLGIQMKISTTINFTPFTEHFYCMFRMTFSLNVDHNFLPVTCVPKNSRLLEVLQTRPLKLVIKIRDHIFYLFSPFSFPRWNWRLLLRKRLLPPGQEENLFHHKTECIDTWEKFRKIIYLSKIPWWIIYCRYEKVFDSKSLFSSKFHSPPHGLKSFYC